MEPIRILIADDHQLVIDGLRLMLSTEEDFSCTHQANNGQEVLDILAKDSVDVLLMDINMPVMNGVDACKKIQKSYPEVKILALSMLKEASLIKMMLKYGAKGYLLKNAGKDEVIEAIRMVAKGKSYYSEEISEIILQSLSGSRAKKSASPFPQLSRREKQVLGLIVEEFTTGEIAEKLFISFGTVETHRRNLLIKLGARNTAGLVRAALEYDLLESSEQ